MLTTMPLSINDIRDRTKKTILDTLSLKINALKQKKVISRAWVFGSFAKGNWNALSDLDLIVTTFEKIDDLAIEADHEIDLILLTENEFNLRYNKNQTFKTIVDSGILL